MKESLYTLIMQGIIPLLGVVLTVYVVPYVKTVVKEKNLEQYKVWADVAVKSAEMIYNVKHAGAEKKAYATELLDKLINGKKTVLTKEQISAIIEASVKEMKDAVAED